MEEPPAPAEGSPAAVTSATSAAMAPATSASAAVPAERMAEQAEALLREKLKGTFDAFDADCSGEMSTEEITRMLRSLGVTAAPEKIEVLMREADTDGSGEVSFDEFFEAMKRSDEFAELFTAAAHPADVAKSMEQANERFLSTFNEFVVDSLAGCQNEVLAAKVPLSSFGRVKSALDTVKSRLAGTAQQLLTAELTELRTKAIESLNAQRAQMDAAAKIVLASAVEGATREALAQAAATAELLRTAEAEIDWLRERSAKPEAIIAGLESELATQGAELARVSDKLAKVEARSARSETDWKEGYQKALALSTVPPPPPPPESPFYRVLTQGYAPRPHTTRAPPARTCVMAFTAHSEPSYSEEAELCGL